MNQERFDELTRALAHGRVSRGAMLKAAAAGTFVSLFSMLGAGSADAQSRPPRHCNRTVCREGADCCSGICVRVSPLPVGVCTPCVSAGGDCSFTGGNPCCDTCAACVNGRCVLPQNQVACGANECCATDRCERCVTSIFGNRCEGCKTQPPAQGGNCEICDATVVPSICRKIECPTHLVLDPSGQSCSCKCPAEVLSGQTAFAATASLAAASDPCTGQCCGPCQECGSDGCVEKQCGDCETCNPQTGDCETTCGSCQKCDESTGSCRNCNTCETCPNGTCIPIPGAQPCGDGCCGSCQVCEGGQCHNCTQQCEPCRDGVCVKVGEPCGNNCCEPTEQCCNGSCCPTGLTCCGSSCTDLKNDPSNCGTCGNNCYFQCTGNKCCNGICGFSATDCSEFRPCP